MAQMSAVIGGEERCGFGWNMLMECLGEGRGISLPAGGVAASRLCTLAVGGYARVRKQFKVPIAEMEGVQEKLSNIGMITFQVAAAQAMFDAVLANGEKPPVLSAIMKHECTELGRKATNEGMDVIGGAGISRGPMNFLAPVYVNTPVCITVEGANALTRSLIIFGQGLTRSHPHLLHLIKAIQDGDNMPAFNKHLADIINHAFTNLGRSVTRGLAVQVVPKGNDLSTYYESHMNRLASNFAFCADVGLTMGGNILVYCQHPSLMSLIVQMYLLFATNFYSPPQTHIHTHTRMQHTHKYIHACIHECRCHQDRRVPLWSLRRHSLKPLHGLRVPVVL
jgi:acyl-CoA dehydrogenase